MTRSRHSVTIYPHTCGDDADLEAHEVLGCGSPPRLRGQQARRGGEILPVRFTPADAGTTPVLPLSRWLATVHPRACGDHPVSRSLFERRSGSPPRAWGRRDGQPHRADQRRFTPMRVGTTGSARRASRRRSVHPRTRGTIAVGRRAGALTTVHPHTRGDDRLLLSGDFGQLGSPPRTRGQLQPAARVLHVRRFTPTRVGTTHREFAEAHGRSVHPRTRGDNFHAHLRLPTWSPVVC